MPTSESEVSSFCTVLGPPLRRSTIRIIGEAGSVSSTDLKARLGVSGGTLYYGIAQDKGKIYVLTPKGKLAYRLLVESEEKLISRGVKAEKRPKMVQLAKRSYSRWCCGRPAIRDLCVVAGSLG